MPCPFDFHRIHNIFAGVMNTISQDTVRRILHRLDDAKREIQDLQLREDYPISAKFERAHDALEKAEKFLKETISTGEDEN